MNLGWLHKLQKFSVDLFKKLDWKTDNRQIEGITQWWGKLQWAIFRCVLSGWHLRWDFHKFCWKTILQIDTPLSFLWQFAGFYHLALTCLSKPWALHLTWLAFGKELACSGQPFIFPCMNIGQEIILSGCHWNSMVSAPQGGQISSSRSTLNKVVFLTNEVSIAIPNYAAHMCMPVTAKICLKHNQKKCSICRS